MSFPLLRRRRLLLVAGAALVPATLPRLASAQGAWPNKPVRVVVPFAPGGTTDILARALAPELGKAFGQTFIIDNKPGAGGNLGSDIVAKSPPDGYTLLMGTVGTHAINASLYPKMPFDPVKDFVPIVLVAGVPNVLVMNPAKAESAKINTVADLIRYAKANPGKLNFGTSGTGTLQHFAGELFNHQAGVNIVHVPYKGTAAVIPAMLSGEVQVGYGSLIGTRPQMQANRLRGIAVTSRKRSPSVDLPSVAESGLPNYEVDQWYGVITSSKVPKPIVMKLNAAVVEALKAPDVAQRLASDGSTPVGSSPEQFNAHIKAEIAKWKRLVKEANIKLHTSS